MSDRTDTTTQRDGHDPSWREHFETHYGASGAGYDDYAPAYRHGSQAAGDSRYEGRHWDEVEPALRSSWEARGGASAWDRMKAAVRHGWERIVRGESGLTY